MGGDDTLNKARERADEMGLPYEGALLPLEAYALQQSGARLVDVRSRAELDFVGAVSPCNGACLMIVIGNTADLARSQLSETSNGAEVESWKRLELSLCGKTCRETKCGYVE